jgi:long-chain acyl-CoA synthetase
MDVDFDQALAEQCARTAAGVTVPALLHRNATEYGDLPALSMFGVDAVVTWRELRDRIAHVSRGLAGLGLGTGDRMIILIPGQVEHWIVDLAATHLGAIPCTAYATLSSDQLRYLGQHSKAKVIVLGGAAELGRWAPVLADLPDLRHVVVVDDSLVATAGPLAMSLAELEADGALAYQADPAAFETTWREIRPEQPVTLLYTSGTTGDPKGVLISHHNVAYECVVLEAVVPMPDHPRGLAYLPLAHIAERVLGIYNLVYRAGHATILQDPAMLVPALREVRPVAFFGVPRVWEKMAAGVQAQLAAAAPDARAAVETASALARQLYHLREAGKQISDEQAAQYEQLDQVVLRPLRTLLGLDRVMWAGSGAAPIPVDVLLFLAGLGLDVLEVWGMTETTGGVTVNIPSRFRTGTVGKIHPGMEMRLGDDGEILVRGPLICLGYLRADGGVEPVVDEDGWLATGDVGTIDDDGYLTITDRKKELIITSAGKNIAPAQIENLLRSHPLIAQAVAIGDRRPYVTALIVLDEEVAPAWAAARGVTAQGMAGIAADPVVVAEIQAAVDAANEKLARPEQVKTFHILPNSWTPETGELTPTLKLRRRIIVDRYQPQISAMYGA